MTTSTAESSSRPGPAATALATVVGNLYLLVATLVFSILALLFCWIPPRGRVVFKLARLWSRGILLTSGARMKVTREAELDPSRGYVFMANHQSLFDIPALLASAPVESRFMAKRSLFQIPLFGWVLWAGGYVSIDRRSDGSARAGFDRALDALRSGASLVIFPEGTRSLDGRLLPFKRGGLLLALRCGLPVVPVGIRGTLSIRNRESFLIRPGVVELSYGRPIDLDGYGVRDLDRLSEELRARITELAGLD